MSFVAILNEVRNLRHLLRTNDRPIAVGSWSSAVCEAAREAGIPAYLEDDVIPYADLQAFEAHGDRLAKAITGLTVPTGRSFNDWGWWALEHVFMYVSHQGARTRALFDVLVAAHPEASGLVHDMEGFVQGGILRMKADEIGMPVFAWRPEFSMGDAVTKRHDWEILPGTETGVCDEFQGKQLPKSNKPYILMVHTNEVAHLVEPLVVEGSKYFNLAQDRNNRWPDVFTGPIVEARPVRPRRDLEAPIWPEHLTPLAHQWEREIMEMLFITWQSYVAEQYHWTLAAYRRAPIRLFLGGSDHIPAMRARVLACRDLDIPYVLVQHGAFLAHRATYGHPNHLYCDHNLLYSREAARQIRAFGAQGKLWTIGWPQWGSPAARGSRTDPLPPVARKPWLILPSGTGSPDEAATLYKKADIFLDDALAAIAAIDTSTPVMVKLHPVSDNPVWIEQRLLAHGLRNYKLVKGLDPWRQIAEAELVIATESTSTFAAVAMKKPLVVHNPLRTAWLSRFPDLRITSTREALIQALRERATWTPAETPLAYTRIDTDAGRRTVAVLRRILGIRRPIEERERLLRPRQKKIRKAAAARAWQGRSK